MVTDSNDDEDCTNTKNSLGYNVNWKEKNITWNRYYDSPMWGFVCIQRLKWDYTPTTSKKKNKQWKYGQFFSFLLIFSSKTLK